MVLADTGFWVALINRRDRHHSRAVAVMDELEEGLITTWPVATETCHLLGRCLGHLAQTTFMSALGNGDVEVAPLDTTHIGRLIELMYQYRDLPMDLADASLVLLAESLGHGRILSTDRRDFRTYRWKQHHPFHNLLLPDG